MLNTYNTARKNNNLTRPEFLVLGLAALVTLTAIVLFSANKTYFEIFYNREGGFIGYISVLLFIAVFVVSVVYMLRLARYRSIQFCAVLILTGMLSLFFAAETLSNLPDLVHLSTHHFFKADKIVTGTNVNDIVKINETGKIALYWVLIAAGAFYILILPLIYRNNFKAKRFIDKTGIPVPHRNHIIALMVLSALAMLFSAVRASAVFQLDLAAIALLILFCPENIGVFRR
ncbi:hypothetical protein [Mucilaginibacter celer]|uniref:Uncharacterized protein n=1 Tax=Mucilaginibacter celer TaxID=2305508 RepID=A0A494VL17_9SPHI|nr:hypothetical protein [Mucilaginibacter celer]AYL95916.1 hypothetical protein HYN43_011730 [Mucilaginibacter celer]